ncbi:hypothetical protein Acr_03g0010610 [Actinidia rufa]|uniref:Uncharacterized protein n=1 Tax=Actinidia rufa TaxID=165716 RepID=A0A7J0EF75_9ERIC|nr:hypothetical protein Acr_03g0010610 [Actinidia rufa]
MDRIAATNELAFRVGFSGHSGHLRIEPLPPVERPNPLNSLPNFILVSVSFFDTFLCMKHTMSCLCNLMNYLRKLGKRMLQNL